jgi:hypothetical protein
MTTVCFCFFAEPTDNVQPESGTSIEVTSGVQDFQTVGEIGLLPVEAHVSSWTQWLFIL